MIGFAVSTDVETRTLRKSALPWNEGLSSLLHKKIEQLGPPPPSPLVSANGDHALARAAHDAFYEHYPLVLSPDTVWFTIAQGFAQHVNLNVDRLRDRLVEHAGKKTLRVDRPDFELGRDNPWTEVFAEFSQQVGTHVGKLRDLVVCDFSTTTPTSRAASEVLLMDAFQGYFTYEMGMGCGIPSITLLGTVDDWRSVRRRAAMLSEFGLDPWTNVLLPLLDRVVSTAGGDVDVEFWSSFFRYASGSGPSEITGWVGLGAGRGGGRPHGPADYGALRCRLGRRRASSAGRRFVSRVRLGHRPRRQQLTLMPPRGPRPAPTPRTHRGPAGSARLALGRAPPPAPGSRPCGQA